MKCQKCGSPLVSGHLYCDICGAEYQIVPDFEPEIEKSIAESLSDISTTFDESKSPKELKKKEHSVVKKVPSFTKILGIVFVCSVFLLLGVSQITNGNSYKNKQAQDALQKQDYYKAAQIFHNLRKKNYQDAYWYIREAEVKMLLDEEEEAYYLALSALDVEENQEYAYEFLFSYLEQHGNYVVLMDYLKKCEYDSIKEKYREFLCELPRVSVESGNYNETLVISFEKGYEGKIYYTIDGTEPTRQSKLYETPIKLGNGSHIIKAVYENKYQFLGEVISFEYHITSDVPMAPSVSISSGNYSHGAMIEVEVEEGTRVFYTTDLSKPTMESTEYTQPIPMPLGESRYNFIAFFENGISGNITQRNYMLNIKTNLSLQEAETKLIEKLISVGHILDQNGAVKDRYGVFRYFYKFPLSETEMDYYVFEEHYMENQINNPLNHYFAVDVLYGNVYKLLSDGKGNFTRIDF